MATNRRRAPAQPDPSAAANRKVLADRAAREAVKPKIAPAAPKESAATDPLEFLSDEFDRKNFGDGLPTIQRVIYGPDPLLDNADFKERIEKFGVDEIAECSKRAILDKGAMAFTGAQMQSVIARSIKRFGVEKVAQAMYDRVKLIPVRTVEVEVDREDEMLGNPLKEAVNRYGTPGFAPKFMSEGCIAQLGMRGYRIVREINGDPVKVGTLIMTEIPIAIAERRERQYVEESQDNVREAQEHYAEAVDRILTEAPTAGARVLSAGETVSANATENESFLGQQRSAGIFNEEVL
jgi:hypothetical protein